MNSINFSHIFYFNRMHTWMFIVYFEVHILLVHIKKVIFGSPTLEFLGVGLMRDLIKFTFMKYAVL